MLIIMFNKSYYIILGCSDAEFSCNSAVNRDGSIKCIPMRKRCDGHSDCSLSEDEEDCFRLTTLRNDVTHM